jgi:PadR family transcriptional regulator, regulatory protein PadR
MAGGGFMSPRLNMTYPTALVLQALSRGFHYGFDIMDATGLPSGTVYPILRRLDREGLLKSAWEKEATAQREQRPPRRYYEITSAGEAMLAEASERYRVLDQAVPSRRFKPSRA